MEISSVASGCSFFIVSRSIKLYLSKEKGEDKILVTSPLFLIVDNMTLPIKRKNIKIRTITL